MRDLLRDVQHELTVEQERRISRSVGRAEERRGMSALADIQTASAALGEAVQRQALPEDGANSGFMLDAKIIDLWAAERKPASKTIAMHRSDAQWLLDRIGRKPVDQITRQDILAFKTKLVEEGQTATNIKNKLRRIRTLLKYAADNGHAAINVAAGVTIKDQDAGKRKRLPFSLTALNAIFASLLCQWRASGAGQR